MVQKQYSCPCSNVKVDLENGDVASPLSNSCLSEVLEDCAENVNELSDLIQASFMNQDSCGISKVFEVNNQSQWVDSHLKIVSFR